MEAATSWVFLESPRGQPLRESLEAVAASLSIPNKAAHQVVGLWTGTPPEPAQLTTLSTLGLKRLICLEGEESPGDPVLTEGHILLTMKELYYAYRPSLIFFGATERGERLASQLSALLGLGYIAQASYLRLAADTLQITRPLLQGKVAEILGFFPGTTGIVKGFPRAFEVPSEVRSSGAGDLTVEHVTAFRRPHAKNQLSELVETIPDSTATLDIEDAEVVVAGGKGIGSRDAFLILEDLARALGGVVAASRVAVDLKWVQKEKLVGQTGHKIAPDLYIACGISGASQHLAGMKGSRYVLAINTDPAAPIFRVATWGIIGDALEVVPALTEALSRRGTS